MTPLHLTGSSAPQLDAHLYGIRNEFDRLNQELDEARKQREEYKSLYKNQERERRKLIELLFHWLDGKDQICQYCKRHTATGLADDSPSISPVSPSSEYYSPLEEKGVVPDRLDNTENSTSKEISPVGEERNHDGDVREVISVEDEDPAIYAPPPHGSDSISAKEVGKSTWDIEYGDDPEITLKLDLVHELKPEGVSHVAFSPNGKYLAIASLVGIVCIFDVNTGERVSVMRDLYNNPDKDSSYICSAFSPDNNYLATGEYDGKVKIWIISQRRVRNIFRLGDYIRDLNFSPNGKYLVTCSFDETVRIWRLRDGFSRVLISGQNTPLAVQFSPDGRYVASGYNPQKILIWNLRSGRLMARWEGHGRPVSSLVFTPDGKSLLTASWDMTIVLWDVAWLSLDNAEGEQEINSTVTEIASFVGHTREVETLSISPDGKWIVSGSFDKNVRIWDAHKTTLQCTLHCPDKVWSVAFSPVGTYLAIGGEFSQVTIWNYANLY